MVFRKKRIIKPRIRRTIIQEQLQPQMQQLQRMQQQQPPDFSHEQMALMEIMSGGRINKIWGFNNQPVHIHGDLFPRQTTGDNSTGDLFFSQQDETKSLFGFGR